MLANFSAYRLFDEQRLAHSAAFCILLFKSMASRLIGLAGFWHVSC
jgi:hypothetical protein